MEVNKSQDQQSKDELKEKLKALFSNLALDNKFQKTLINPEQYKNEKKENLQTNITPIKKHDSIRKSKSNGSNELIDLLSSKYDDYLIGLKNYYTSNNLATSNKNSDVLKFNILKLLGDTLSKNYQKLSTTQILNNKNLSNKSNLKFNFINITKNNPVLSVADFFKINEHAQTINDNITKQFTTNKSSTSEIKNNSKIVTSNNADNSNNLNKNNNTQINQNKTIKNDNNLNSQFDSSDIVGVNNVTKNDIVNTNEINSNKILETKFLDINDSNIVKNTSNNNSLISNSNKESASFEEKNIDIKNKSNTESNYNSNTNQLNTSNQKIKQSNIDSTESQQFNTQNKSNNNSLNTKNIEIINSDNNESLSSKILNLDEKTINKLNNIETNQNNNDSMIKKSSSAVNTLVSSVNTDNNLQKDIAYNIDTRSNKNLTTSNSIKNNSIVGDSVNTPSKSTVVKNKKIQFILTNKSPVSEVQITNNDKQSLSENNLKINELNTEQWKQAFLSANYEYATKNNFSRSLKNILSEKNIANNFKDSDSSSSLTKNNNTIDNASNLNVNKNQSSFETLVTTNESKDIQNLKNNTINKKENDIKSLNSISNLQNKSVVRNESYSDENNDTSNKLILSKINSNWRYDVLSRKDKINAITNNRYSLNLFDEYNPTSSNLNFNSESKNINSENTDKNYVIKNLSNKSNLTIDENNPRTENNENTVKNNKIISKNNTLTENTQNNLSNIKTISKKISSIPTFKTLDATSSLTDIKNNNTQNDTNLKFITKVQENNLSDSSSSKNIEEELNQSNTNYKQDKNIDLLHTFIPSQQIRDEIQQKFYSKVANKLGRVSKFNSSWKIVNNTNKTTNNSNVNKNSSTSTLPALKSGGFVKTPTVAYLHENEAVVPLDKSNEFKTFVNDIATSKTDDKFFTNILSNNSKNLLTSKKDMMLEDVNHYLTNLAKNKSNIEESNKINLKNISSTNLLTDTMAVKNLTSTKSQESKITEEEKNYTQARKNYQNIRKQFPDIKNDPTKTLSYISDDGSTKYVYGNNLSPEAKEAKVKMDEARSKVNPSKTEPKIQKNKENKLNIEKNTSDEELTSLKNNVRENSFSKMFRELQSQILQSNQIMINAASAQGKAQPPQMIPQSNEFTNSGENENSLGNISGGSSSITNFFTRTYQIPSWRANLG